ncbi:hypothetical protein AAFC00_000706 [Neodothiora populina]|uniref:Alpha/beta-hydrolase n=1 Tax=Neodothiora populina TaxID=2781224 RepID=A0ABR3PDR6_9PEZI
MPSLPPGSRREKLESYSKAVAPVSWEETKIKSLDGTDLSLAVAQLRDLPRTNEINDERMLRVIVYFQGNGASLPPRTLMLSNVLRSVASKNSHDEWIMVGLSYRGYWTSSGHAHQKGIEKDAEAVMDWVLSSYLSPHRNVDLILWGQSIGSGVAAFAAARYTEKYCDDSANWKAPPISRLILETPFVSIKSMLAALYPDWWVPYRHLWPFLRSWWDSEEALRKIASTKQSPKILMVIASRDEIVPPIQADQLEQLCNDLQLDLQRRNVLGALHTQASSLEVGKNIIVEFLTSTNQR